MANQPSYAKIGFTVFVGVLAIVLSLVYLGGVRGSKDLVFAETYYRKSVSGLSVGSPVSFRGVKIGEVCEIGFVGDYYDARDNAAHLIYVKMSFPRRQLEQDALGESSPDKMLAYMVDKGARATVTASGITGLSRIELDLLPDVPRIPVSWTPRHTYIPPSVSLLDSFSDSATKVMNQINKMNLEGMWSNINASVLSLAKTAEGAQALMETRRADVEKLVGDLADTLSSVKEFANEVKENPSLLIRERVRKPLPETRR